jgi:ribonuclease Y
LIFVFAAAIVAAFILGLLFLNIYRKRSSSAAPASVHRHAIGQNANIATGMLADRTDNIDGAHVGGGHLDSPHFDRGLIDASEDQSVATQHARRSEADAYAESTRRLADAEAASARARAEREADLVRRAAEAEAETLLLSARSESSVALAEAERERATAERAAEAIRRAAQDDIRTEQAKLKELAVAADRTRERASERAAELERLAEDLRGEQRHADEVAAVAAAAAAELADRERELIARGHEHVRELERISGLSTDDAKVELMRTVEVNSRRESAILARSIESEARAEANDRARSIIVEAVQRCASEQTTETVVSVMHLPSDEMKGRIIGREGRNIRSFEAITGVNVVIDDTPEAVLLSCFDPARREVGRLTLEKLVLDGRIHPHRIEEAYEQSKAEVEALCVRAATDALADVGIHDLDERLIPTLGRLKYRTSYGQNVLGHLVETAHIGGVMAAELGLDPDLIKRCAFLHDIGKALTHEVQGSHAIIGAELLRRYGESEAVAHAVEAHHNEVQPRTVEAVLTQAADACSAARPGARRETLESYVKRLQRIEEIATAKDGVEKVFAMQAGREVRVMVQPESVDDLEAQVMAREIAKQIEDELTYPGQIRVTVVRESRASEVAH